VRHHARACTLLMDSTNGRGASHTAAGSALHRYQGVDWRLEQAWNCNGRVSPARNSYYDGVEMDPYEVGALTTAGLN
jgi:hypothetical protein